MNVVNSNKQDFASQFNVNLSFRDVHGGHRVRAEGWSWCRCFHWWVHLNSVHFTNCAVSHPAFMLQYVINGWLIDWYAVHMLPPTLFHPGSSTGESGYLFSSSVPDGSPCGTNSATRANIEGSLLLTANWHSFCDHCWSVCHSLE